MRGGRSRLRQGVTPGAVDMTTVVEFPYELDDDRARPRAVRPRSVRRIRAALGVVALTVVATFAPAPAPAPPPRLTPPAVEPATTVCPCTVVGPRYDAQTFQVARLGPQRMGSP
ncbi:hypothetical protein IC607_10340 [Cellulomonas sp. JH27-2]|uniref:hypothetical protein n=1 Tax=Cellulomonas sp. JH27-2 TaxID=2774139 RepID=UPI001783F4E3|nr:hypothetical protein [Cellulomonas sp. JH27-2]MBD8059365.1 hypothetical protein [Cellulomonas sp. JH27-2]